MQPWRPLFQQALTHIRHHVQAEGADRGQIVAEAFQALANPARNLGAAGIGKTRQLLIVGSVPQFT